MPAPNLGLVGAYGGAGLQHEIQKMVAERREQEQLALENALKQREAERLDAQQRATEAYQTKQVELEAGRNKTFADEAATNLLETQNRAGPKRNIIQLSKRPARPGRDAPGTYTVSAYEDTLEELSRFPESPEQGAGGSDFNRVIELENSEREAAGKPRLTSTEVNQRYDEFRKMERQPPSPLQEDLAIQRISEQYIRQSASYRAANLAANNMQTAWNRMQRDPSGKATPTAAQAIAVYFQKALDPPSVVREGEYARSILTEPLINRLLGWAEQTIGSGGVGIPQAELLQYVQLAREIADAAKIDEPRERARAEARAKRVLGDRYDPVLIFGEGSAATPRPGPELPPPDAGGAPPRQPAPGAAPGAAPGLAPLTGVNFDAGPAAGGAGALQLQPGERQQGANIVKDNPDGTYTITGKVRNGQIERR